MTLCIAASCRHENTNMIVLCADMKVGTWAAKAEIGYKLRWARLNWPAMISGEMSRAIDLVKTFNVHLNSIELNSWNVLDAMRYAGNIFREKLADEIVRRNLSVSYEYLKKNKSKFPPPKVLETYTQIGQLDSEAELIITGFVEGEPYIFVVERDCTVTQRENFACVGTGAYIAEPALYQRRQNRSATLARTIYHTYEAKRLGEIAEGVGEFTVMMAFAPPKNIEIRYLPIEQDAMTFLEEKYKEYGLKSTLDFKWPEGPNAAQEMPDSAKPD
jgi:hypothetical protein